jgi:hypothetical protein
LASLPCAGAAGALELFYLSGFLTEAVDGLIV